MVSPVSAPVLDPFRLPDGPYGPGNRGIEYATQAGDLVSAVAPGIVVFSGSVAGSWFVTVLHGTSVADAGDLLGPQPLRSTYGYIDPPLVAKGERVERGQPLATTGPGFHLTARVGARYVDPAIYLEAGGPPLRFEVRLVAAPG